MADSNQLALFSVEAIEKAKTRRKVRSKCVPPVKVDSYDRRGRKVSGYHRRCPGGRALRPDEKRRR